jgi:hypothetical protein
VSNLSLYELTHEIIPLEEELEKAGGEVTEDNKALVQRLEQLELMTKQKIDSFGMYYQSLKALATFIELEIDRMTERLGHVENKMNRLKAAAKESMEARGIVKIEGNQFTVSIQKNGGLKPMRFLVGSNEIPEKWYRFKKELDISKIRESLMAGDKTAQSIAELGETGTSVRIR